MAGNVIVIAGPTASGKTALSVALAKELGGEIVSADSMQVYRGMDIGTAKATAEEQSEAAHHMLDVADPGEAYSAARYVDEAAACCEDILARAEGCRSSRAARGCILILSSPGAALPTRRTAARCARR